MSNLKGAKIYESNAFYPISAGEKSDSKKLAGAYSTHLWDESWVKFRYLRMFSRKLGLIKIYRELKKMFA